MVGLWAKTLRVRARARLVVDVSAMRERHPYRKLPTLGTLPDLDSVIAVADREILAIPIWQAGQGGKAGGLYRSLRPT